MPIFEADEELTDAEMERQQKSLTDKMFRLESKQFMDALNGFQGGDHWEDEEM